MLRLTAKNLICKTNVRTVLVLCNKFQSYEIFGQESSLFKLKYIKALANGMARPELALVYSLCIRQRLLKSNINEKAAIKLDEKHF